MFWHKIKTISYRSRISAVIFATLILLTLTIEVFLYEKAIHSFKAELFQNMESAVSTSALLMDSEILDSIIPQESYRNEVPYRVIEKKLFSLLEINRNLVGAYIIRKTESNEYKFLIGTRDFDPGFLLRRKIAVERSFSGRFVVDYNIGVYKEKHFVTGYAPVYSTNGNIDYIIGLELNAGIFSDLTESLKKRLLTSFVFSLLLAGIVSWIMVKILIQPIHEMVIVTEAITEGDYDLTIDIPGNDEIARLAGSFNTLILKLQQAYSKLENQIEVANGELIEKNRELIEKNRELQENQQQLINTSKLAVLGKIAASVAHEIRNPLGIIKASALILEKELRENESQAELINFIVSETDRLNSFISDFLQYAKPKEPKIEEFEIQDLVDNSLVYVKHRLSSANIQCSVEYCRSNFMAKGDFSQLRQVLMNLLINAVQATGEKGRIQIKVWADEEFWGIEIKDNGGGIKPHIKDNLFQPFFTTKDTGTGLGLSITKKIIENHCGTVKVKSDTGEWTVFEIAIPFSLEVK